MNDLGGVLILLIVAISFAFDRREYRAASRERRRRWDAVRWDYRSGDWRG